MSEVSPIPSEPRPAEREYQPLSGFALGAIGVAGLFGIILLVIGTTAFTSRKPMVFPALLVLAALGLLLSILGRVQIQRSEGTRAGLGLTRAAWWISVLGGAGYLAYMGASELAINQQSRAAAKQWVDYLKEGEVASAFLFTLEPDVRAGLSPDERALQIRFGEREWPGFRDSEFVHFVLRNGQNIQMEHQGLNTWERDEAGFTVVQSFIFRCPEGVFTAPIVLKGQESQDENRRVWQVISFGSNLYETGDLTRYGRMVRVLRPTGGRFYHDFLTATKEEGRRNQAYQMTLPSEKREGAEPPAEGFEWADRSLLKTGDGGRLSDSELAMFRTTLSKGGLVYPVNSRTPFAEASEMIVTEDAVTLEFNAMLPVYERQEYAVTRVIVVCDDPEVLQVLQEARAEGTANPDNTDSTSADQFAGRKPTWRVTEIHSDLEWQTLPQGPPS